MKAKPKRKPRRVVLGVGHPWFIFGDRAYRAYVGLGCSPDAPTDKELRFGDLGNWNKIRLVAEVLK